MTAKAIQPTDWHQKPEGHVGPCPVCGYEGKYRIWHRAEIVGDGALSLYYTRRKAKTGWREIAVGPNKSEMQDEQKARRRDNKIIRLVRLQAGTDAILADPDKYLAAASHAQSVIDNRGEALFPSQKKNGEHTLASFFEEYCLPLSNGGEDFVASQRTTLKYWELATGNPPLKEIDNVMMARFKKFLMGLRGRRRHQRQKPRSVRNRLSHVQCILDKAGPPHPHNRDAAGILDRVPYVKPPRVTQEIPQIADEQDIVNCYLAAVGMEMPKVNGFKTPAWWRALIVLAYNTGLRRGTLFSLRMDDIDWQKSRLVIASGRMKSGRGHLIHLNATTLEHLRAIRTDRELVFPWYRHPKRFYDYFHRLQDMAGIPKDDHFTLHAIRRTLATRLWELEPQAAPLALGHAGSDVTIRHYVQSSGIVSRALDALPQPEAFTTKM